MLFYTSFRYLESLTTNSSPVAIVEDARLPNKYRMLLSIVDVIFADVAQPDQARIVIHNAQSFLKDQGHVIISIKASCVDSTIPPEMVYANEVQLLKQSQFKPLEQVTLEPYERGHAMVTGTLTSWFGRRATLMWTYSIVPTTSSEREVAVYVADRLVYLCLPIKMIRYFIEGPLPCCQNLPPRSSW